MFLPLTPVIAAGRAIFAAAAVGASGLGHAGVGHGHMDFSSMILAFFILLAAAWRTNCPRKLLAASLMAQLVVHFTAPSGMHNLTPHMLLLHAGCAVLAWILLWKFELCWEVLSSALCRLLGTLFVHTVRPWSPARVAVVTAHQLKRFLLLENSQVRRGPPVFA